MKKVSCIIPAYNEEKNIGNILKTLSPLVGVELFEVIVINDGSTDKTKEIVSTYEKIIYIENIVNQGKSNAVAKGIEKSGGDYVLMLDGDLIGIEKQNILDLINPIINKTSDITISYRGNTPRIWIKIFGIENLSGERCFSKNFLSDQLESIKKLPGYGLEVFINEKIINSKLKIKSIPMENVIIQFKWTKFGLYSGIIKEIKMWKNIFDTISFQKYIRQIFQMKKLLVK